VRPGHAGSGLVTRLLRVPLFLKILIANGVLFILGAGVGTALALRLARRPDGPIEVAVLFAVTGVALSLVVNAIILKLALRPLQLQEDVASRVRAGDWEARVPASALADRDLDRLMRLFNEMLDDVSAFRARIQDVAARALRAEEEERKRISRELHDDTAQVLTALLLRLRLAQQTDDPDRVRVVLAEMRADLVEAVDGVRRLAAGLRPPALDELGLAGAIQKYAEDACRSYDIDLTLDLDAIRGGYPPDVELALYRIAQEALSNAVRHSEGTRISLCSKATSEQLRLTVEDDGRGFDPDVPTEGGRGLGIQGMMERASYMGAVVMIDSRPGEGTRVSAVIAPDSPASVPLRENGFEEPSSSPLSSSEPSPSEPLP
jgi:two-component system sensor histidine kinase UhpB